MRTLAVIPAFNEEATVGEVVARSRAIGLDVMVVDDGSTDDTSAAAAGAGARVLRLPINIGVGGALRCGFAYAVGRGYDRAVHVDADLQHEPEAIPVLLAEGDAGTQLVIGSRFGDQEYRVSWPRRVMMRLLSSLVSRKIGVSLSDVTSGFRMVSRPLLDVYAVEYPTEYLGDTVEAILIAHKHGASIAQVSTPMLPRAGGRAVPRIQAAGYLARVLFAILVRSWRGTTT